MLKSALLLLFDISKAQIVCELYSVPLLMTVPTGVNTRSHCAGLAKLPQSVMRGSNTSEKARAALLALDLNGFKWRGGWKR